MMPLSGRDEDPRAPPSALASSRLMSTSLGRSAFRTHDAALPCEAVGVDAPSWPTSSNTRSVTPRVGAMTPPAATGLTTGGESSANIAMAESARTLSMSPLIVLPASREVSEAAPSKSASRRKKNPYPIIKVCPWAAAERCLLVTGATHTAERYLQPGQQRFCEFAPKERATRHISKRGCTARDLAHV